MEQQAFDLDFIFLLKKIEQSKTPHTALLRSKNARKFIYKNVCIGTDRSNQLLDRVSSAYLSALNNMV